MFSNLIYLAFYASMAKAFAGKTAVENANLGVQGNSWTLSQGRLVSI